MRHIKHSIEELMKNLNQNNNPNILFLTHVGQPGGAELVMLRLCAAVSDHCRVIHFERGGLETLLQDNNIQSEVLKMPETLTNLRRDGGWKNLIQTIPAIISMIGALIKKEKQADIIICMSQKSFIMAAITKIFTRKPIIWFMNDLISEDHFSKALIFLMTKVFARFANKIILNSQASYEAWKNAGGAIDKAEIIYPGSDISAIDQQLENTDQINHYRQEFNQNDTPIIGIFGRISHWKGQDIFLKALSNVQNVQGVIVGGAHFDEDNYLQTLKNFTAENNLQNRVKFIGHINDVPCAMAACDIIVHASTQPEPFGLVIVEAMLTGRPVIVSNAGGAKEIMLDNETGSLTPPSDEEALTLAIQKILGDPEKTKDMTEKARHRAIEKFSNDQMIVKFKTLLKQVS